MRALILCLLAAAVSARAPLHPTGIQSDKPAESVTSPDGRFAWLPGGAYVSVRDPKSGREKRRLRLPSFSGESRRLVFSPGGDYFCVVDETVSEVGLHLKARGGAAQAKAVVTGATLYLMRDDGRIAFKKRLRDTHSLVEREFLAPQTAADGTLAVLSEDSGPSSTHGRALLEVFGPKGAALLKLDYLHWRRIDEFKLSRNGDYLAVRGYGRIEEAENWGLALAVYHTRSKRRVIHKARISREGEAFSSVSDHGAVCCATVNGAPHTLGIDGNLILKTSAR